MFIGRISIRGNLNVNDSEFSLMLTDMGPIIGVSRYHYRNGFDDTANLNVVAYDKFTIEPRLYSAVHDPKFMHRL